MALTIVPNYDTAATGAFKVNGRYPKEIRVNGRSVRKVKRNNGMVYERDSIYTGSSVCIDDNKKYTDILFRFTSRLIWYRYDNVKIETMYTNDRYYGNDPIPPKKHVFTVNKNNYAVTFTADYPFKNLITSTHQNRYNSNRKEHHIDNITKGTENHHTEFTYEFSTGTKLEYNPLSRKSPDTTLTSYNSTITSGGINNRLVSYRTATYYSAKMLKIIKWNPGFSRDYDVSWGWGLYKIPANDNNHDSTNSNMRYMNKVIDTGISKMSPNDVQSYRAHYPGLNTNNVWVKVAQYVSDTYRLDSYDGTYEGRNLAGILAGINAG